MPTSAAAVEAWTAGYLRAWRSNEPADIRAIFADDAVYRADPWTVSARGRDAIVEFWLDRRDDPGTWEFDWHVLAVADRAGFVQGVTRYDDGTVYSNLWVVRLDADGRATEFTEWWMDQSDPS